MTERRFYKFVFAVSLVVMILSLFVSVMEMGAPWIAFNVALALLPIMHALDRLARMPKFQVGDILVHKAIDDLESWELDRVYPVRVEGVGKTKYRLFDTMYTMELFQRPSYSIQYVNRNYRLATDADMYGIPLDRALGYQVKVPRALA